MSAKTTNISEEIMLMDKKHGEIVGGRYIDTHGRLRILTGEYSGEVLHRHEYSLIEKVLDAEKIIHTVWPK